MANFKMFYTHKNNKGTYDVSCMDFDLTGEALRDAETTDFGSDEAQTNLKQIIFNKTGAVIDSDSTVDVVLKPTITKH